MTTHALRYNSSALNHVVIIFVSRRMYDNCGTLHLPLLVKEVPFYTNNVIRKPGELPLVELKALLVRKGITFSEEIQAGCWLIRTASYAIHSE
ncbi:hypothetical protein EMCRGX_G017991 [Ephydatia muelleri]